MTDLVDSTASDDEALSANAQTFVLKPTEELRFEVDGGPETPALLKLVSGSAEVFGSELACDRLYRIHRTKLAVFSWKGAKVILDGPCKLVYTSDETPMIQVMNVHENLQIFRQRAQETGDMGPRVLVAGAVDSGKSCIVHVLLNYAIRSGHNPVFVDLDVGDNEISCPGSISASPVLQPHDLESGWNSTLPLVYFFGHATIQENQEHYVSCCENLASSLKQRISQQLPEKSTGYIINTPGWSDASNLDVLMAIVDFFQVDVILVLGHERLSAQLQQVESLKSRNVVIAKLPRSGGVNVS